MIIEINQTHVTFRCPTCGAAYAPIEINTLQRGLPNEPDAILLPPCPDSCGATTVLAVRYDDGSLRHGIGLARFKAINVLGERLVALGRVHADVTVRPDPSIRFDDAELSVGVLISVATEDEEVFAERRYQRGLPQLPGAPDISQRKGPSR